MTNAETTDKAAAVAEQGATVAPEKAPSKKATSPKKAAPKGKKNVKGGNAKAAAKKAEVIAMMKRAKGVTLAEIAEFTGWQKHTIRGFVSILGSKGGETIESSKNEAGDRVYRIAK